MSGYGLAHTNYLKMQKNPRDFGGHSSQVKT